MMSHPTAEQGFAYGIYGTDDIYTTGQEECSLEADPPGVRFTSLHIILYSNKLTHYSKVLLCVEIWSIYRSWCELLWNDVIGSHTYVVVTGYRMSNLFLSNIHIEIVMALANETLWIQTFQLPIHGGLQWNGTYKTYSYLIASHELIHSFFCITAIVRDCVQMQ